MTRAKMTCPCGWVFFLSEAPAEGIACPNCNEPLNAPPGLPVTRATPSQVAEEATRRARRIAGGITASLALVALFAMLLVLFNLRSRPPSTTTPALGILRESDTSKKPSEIPRDPPPPVVEPRDVGRLIDQLAWRQTVAGITAEFLRGRGSADANRIAQSMVEAERGFEGLVEELRRKGESHAVPEHVKPGDKLLFFRGLDVTRAPAGEKEKALGAALRLLRVGESWDIAVRRGLDVVGFTTYFKEKPREVIELLASAQLPEADPEPVTPVVAPKPPPTVEKAEPLPEDLVRRVREMVQSLHRYHLSFLSADELTRMDALLKEGRGYAEDVEFLTERVLVEMMSAVSDDTNGIRTQRLECEARARQAEAGGGDVLIKNDGTRLEGRVVEAGDDVVKIEVTRGGMSGVVTVSRGDIREIVKGGGAAAEFPGRLSAAKGKLLPLLDLAKWCKAGNLPAQRDLVHCHVLEIEPGNETARLALGYARTDSGWYTRDRVAGAQRKGNEIEYDGRTFTVDEFKAMLKRKGYAEIGGRWNSRRPWSLRAANLHRDAAKLALSVDNASVTERIRLDTERTVDMITKAVKETIKKVPLGMMVAPLGDGEAVTSGDESVYKGRRGIATVKVEAPSEFIDCKIRAVAEVTVTGGQIRVWVTNEAGGSKDLCKIETVRRFDSVVDVSEVARGFKSVTVHAEMSGPWVSTDNGTVMFLPGTRNDTGVFEITAQVAEPLKSINALLAAVKDAPVETAPSRDPVVVSEREAVLKKVEAAVERLGAVETLDVIVQRMREETKELRYPGKVEAPAEYGTVLKYVPDPLTLEVGKLTNAALMEIGEWWGKLTAADRRKFAVHFGLWCAAVRYEKEKQK
jgi:hypothetical protein